MGFTEFHGETAAVHMVRSLHEEKWTSTHAAFHSIPVRGIRTVVLVLADTNTQALMLYGTVQVIDPRIQKPHSS